MHTEFWCGDVKKSDHLEGPGVDRKKILELILKEEDGGWSWTGMVWPSG